MYRVFKKYMTQLQVSVPHMEIVKIVYSNTGPVVEEDIWTEEG
jgi:hypothetical protein